MTDAIPHSPAVLFLSGAGLPPWIWDGVRSRLAPGTPSAVAARPAPGARLSDYVDAALASAPDGRFTLVAHSVGGVVAVELMRRAPERVAGLLCVSAVVSPRDRSYLGALPVPQRWLVGAVMRVAGTRPPDGVIRSGLARGLPDEVAARLVADFTPESRALYTDRVGGIPGGVRRGVPCGAVVTTRDRELPEAVQRASAARLPSPWQRELPTGHLAMLEDPVGLAGALADFAAGIPAR